MKDSFWTRKTLAELAAEQGLELPQREIDQILGTGAELWQSDREFDSFLDWLAAKRQQARQAEQSRQKQRVEPKV